MNSRFEREKLIEALSFFATSVKYPGWIKLLKLVYYLDLVHLRRTGRTVTGLQYNAWPMGPVPETLYGEMQDAKSDLHRHFEIAPATKEAAAEYDVPTIDTDEARLGVDTPRARRWVPGTFKPKEGFRLRYLSKREYEIAKTLAEIFQEATAEQMSDVAHSKFGPWRKALFKGKQQNADRPVIDMLDGIVACCDAKLELPIEELKERIAEREENERALG